VRGVTWSGLHDKVMEIAYKYDLDVRAGALDGAAVHEKAAAEAVLHELGHALALNPKRKRFMTLWQTSNAVDRLSPEKQDENEILACAIEVACVRSLGLTMSVRLVADYAADDMKTARWLRRPGAILKEICRVAGTPLAVGCGERLKNLLLTPSS
jgi:hypothetical protein